MSEAFGSPGTSPKWTSSRKNGIGTSYDRSCHSWFTLRQGIVNEIYYPTVDCPCTRELQFLISDGETFCHEEKCDLEPKTECPEEGVLYYRVESSACEHRYMLVKEMITDPHASVFLLHARLEIHDQKLRDKLHLYAFLIPHLKRHGRGAHRLGLQAIGQIARELFGRDFMELTWFEQEQLLFLIRNGKPKGAKDIWKQLPVQRYWSLLIEDCVDVYYAHPWSWDEIGYGGPAYPRAYMRLERGEPEPWEVEEWRYEWLAPSSCLSGSNTPTDLESRQGR
jgi:hypothetical protein